MKKEMNGFSKNMKTAKHPTCRHSMELWASILCLCNSLRGINGAGLPYIHTQTHTHTHTRTHAVHAHMHTTTKLRLTCTHNSWLGLFGNRGNRQSWTWSWFDTLVMISDVTRQLLPTFIHRKNLFNLFDLHCPVKIKKKQGAITDEGWE